MRLQERRTKELNGRGTTIKLKGRGTTKGLTTRNLPEQQNNAHQEQGLTDTLYVKR